MIKIMQIYQSSGRCIHYSTLYILISRFPGDAPEVVFYNKKDKQVYFLLKRELCMINSDVNPI